jgi:hypothetical protein
MHSLVRNCECSGEIEMCYFWFGYSDTLWYYGIIVSQFGGCKCSKILKSNLDVIIFMLSACRYIQYKGVLHCRGHAVYICAPCIPHGSWRWFIRDRSLVLKKILINVRNTALCMNINCILDISNEFYKYYAAYLHMLFFLAFRETFVV